MSRTNFNTYLGFEPRLSQPGKTVIEVTLAPHLLNRAGYLHGGAMMTLMDALMGYAATSLLQEGESIVTSSITTHFLEPISAGEIIGDGAVIADNGSYLLTEARLKDAAGRTLALSRGQFSRRRQT